jgi:hypothetical protein
MTKHNAALSIESAQKTVLHEADVAMVEIEYLALGKAIRAELEEYFYDGASQTLGEYAVGNIVDGILERVEDCVVYRSATEPH